MKIPTNTRVWLIVAVIGSMVILLDNKPSIRASIDEPVILVPQLGHVDFFLYRPMSAAVLSPNNFTIATAGGDGSIKFFDVASGLLIRSFSAHANGVQAIAYSPDGKQLASGGGDGKVRLWDVETGQLLRTLEGHKTPVNCVAFSFDGDTLASGSGSYGNVGSVADNTIRLWDVRTGQSAGILVGHQASIESVAFNAEGTSLVSGSLDNTLKIWSIREQRLVRTIPTEATYSLAFSPDGKRIASALSKRVVFWDVQTGSQIKEINHSHYTATVLFTPDWRAMAIANELWDPEKGVKVRSLEARESGYSLAVSNDGTLLVTESNNALMLWDLRGPARLHSFRQTPGLTTGLAFSKTGDKLAWGRKDHVYIWNLTTGQLHRNINAHTNEVNEIAFSPNINEVAFSPDGQSLASCTDTELKIWSVSDGRLLRDLNSTQKFGDFRSVQFSPNGKLLAVGGAVDEDQAAIAILNPTTGRLIRTMAIRLSRPSTPGLARLSHARPLPGGPSMVVHSLSFSPDGRSLVSGDEDANVILWSVKNGRRLKTMKGHDSAVNSVAFSPNGKRIVSGSFDQTVKLWDVRTGSTLRTFKSHHDRVTSVRLSPDEQTIVSGSLDRGVRLWSANDGRQLALLENHEAAVTFVGFSPDGRIAASSSLDGRINLWSTSSKTLISTILSFDDFSWINFTPDGFYNSSPEALKHVAWRVGSRVYPGNSFAAERLNPQLLLARLTGSVPTPIEKPPTFSPITELGEAIPVAESEKKLMNDWKDHRFYALVIGNNQYRHLPPLETAVKDATELKDILEQRFDFKVKLLVNATRDDIITELQKYENLPKNSSLLIFYAGHGLYIDFGTQKEGVWQPVDAENTNRSRWIRSGEILDSIKLNTALHILIISDSCFAGTLLNRGNAYVPINERPEVLFELMKRPSWTLVASGGNEPVADLGEDGHSVFAHALLKGLQTIPQNIFTMDYLFRNFLYEQVQEKLRQEPKIRPIPGFEDDGKFIFVRRRR